jgi:hypothetical protein
LEALQQGLRVVSVIAQAVLVAGLAAWGISRLVSVRRSRAAA